LIREKKRFEEFSPNDVLGRILTHELMDKEIQHRKKIGELEAKLNNLKVKEVALHSNKSSKPTTSSKHSTPPKPSKSKFKKVEERALQVTQVKMKMKVLMLRLGTWLCS
jgi:hypothetical protein